jgi:hypothetical protein
VSNVDRMLVVGERFDVIMGGGGREGLWVDRARF